MASTAHPSRPLVTIIEIDPEAIGFETELSALLPAATQARLAAFRHPARRRQTLWGRLAAFSEARRLGLALTERPPYSPVLADADGCERMLSIAHTGSYVALGVACAADPVMGLDLETVRPVRSVPAMSEAAFGAALRWPVVECERRQSLDPFFLVWGMKESEIKLNRGGSRYRLRAPSEEAFPVVTDTETGDALALFSFEDGALRLTVLTGHETPTLIRLTASELAAAILKPEDL